MVDTYRTLGDPVDERTEALGLPLPNLLNDSRDDVGRLRSAMELIDAALQLMGLDMDSRDDALAAADQALAARAALLEYAAARPAAVVYGYDAQGRVATVTATMGGVARVTTYTYDAQGRVATVAYPVAGGLVRTESFTYDAQGRASGATAVETNP
ncbi:MAG: RHS repeat domain-containing protein [Acidovorax sp.]|nr:RHS repeat domain-containing protein [Acidovorax sp.]